MKCSILLSLNAKINKNHKYRRFYSNNNNLLRKSIIEVTQPTYDPYNKDTEEKSSTPKANKSRSSDLILK